MEEPATVISIASGVSRFLSAASLGVFAGGMLTEGCLLVPWWRSLAPGDFLAWYAANGQRLQGFFGPLTTVTALLTLTAAFFSFREGHPGRWLTTLAAILLIVAVATFFLYFGKANAGFAKGTFSVEETGPELTRRAKWHWWRTGLSFAALAAALLSWCCIRQTGEGPG